MKQPGLSVAVVFLKENKYLFGRRHPDISGGNYWCLPMGKLDRGEALLECAKREVLEETGLDVEELLPVALANVVLEDSHYLTLGFLAVKWQGVPQITAPREMTEWQWFYYDEIPGPIFKPSKEIIDVLREGRTFSLENIIEV
ncbi:MAG: nucleotide triphosphate diphosphatase NUDT15 [Peptococcaceae bacterium]